MKPQAAANPAGIVLAGGRSRRFGGDKRLAPYGPDHHLLSKTISLIEPYLNYLVVATRPDDAERREALLGQWHSDPHIELFAAPSADQGMGHTLAEAVAQLVVIERQRRKQFSAVLIMLADMPKVGSATIFQVLAAAEVDKIVRPCYFVEGKSQVGHPVVFGRQWFDALQTLEGDRGARRVVEDNAWARIDLPVDDAGILFDIDTPGDLDNVQR